MNGNDAAVREYIAGAGRALDRGDAASASRELVVALQFCFGLVRSLATPDPDRYRRAWEEVARELAKLPPTLVRHAARIIAERDPG